jgi:hypothetical protein
MAYIGAGVTRFNTADELTVTGDATIDTTTLVVDSTNNRVGIGTSSPATELDVAGNATVGTNTGGILNVKGGSTTSSQVRFFDGGTGRARIGVPTGQTYLSLSGSDTLTADVVIDSSGNVGIGASSPTSTASAGPTLEISGTAGGNLVLSDSNATTGQRAKYFLSQGGTLYIGRSADDGTSPVNDLVINSSGNVGIGTTSPDQTLHVHKGSAGTVASHASSVLTLENSTTGILQFLTPNTAAQQIRFGDPQDDGAGIIQYDHSTNVLQFNANGPERMRIDSSGNLLVGKTSANVTTEGAELRATGQAILVADGTNPILMNRQTSDGDIAVFRKDGTTVGSIGVAATDDVYFAGGTGSTKGIYLNDNGVLPATTGGSASDATVDLGNTVLRWKDLYLSGGVYLGGTGSANHLDDYEEGTWTPYLGGTSSDPTITYTSQDGKYVKVGTMVTLHGRMGWSAKSGGSGFLRLAGFPFNGDHAGTEPAVNFSFTTGFGTTSAPVQGGCVHGNNWAYVYRHASSDARDNISSGLLTGDLGSSGTVYFTITYRSV